MFHVPESKASIAQNRFEFQMPGSERVWSIPKLQFMRPAFARTLEEMTEQQAIWAVLEEFAPGLVDELDDMEQLTALYTAWAEASGVQLGESSGSSTSSMSTEEPSTEISSLSDATSTTSAPTV